MLKVKQSPVSVHVVEVQKLGRSFWNVELRDVKGRRAIVEREVDWPTALRCQQVLRSAAARLLQQGAIRLR